LKVRHQRALAPFAKTFETVDIFADLKYHHLFQRKERFIRGSKKPYGTVQVNE